MGWEGRQPRSKGPKLAPWFGTAPNRRFLRRAAQRGGERMTELAEMNTPIDTGHLRTSWKVKPVLLLVDAAGHLVASSGVETFVDYAPYVEHGTGLFGPKGAKYPIVPKNPDGWLRWIDPVSGQPVFAKKVMHPGSPGNHMVAIAVAISEHELERTLRGVLYQWVQEVEMQNPHARKGMAV